MRSVSPCHWPALNKLCTNAACVFRNSVGEKGKPPCKRCHVEGHLCILAGSRRGGDFSRYRKSKRSTTTSVSWSDNGLGRPANTGQITDNVRGERSSSVEPAFEGIQNPLDALRLLAEAAAENRDEAVSSGGSNWNTRNGSEAAQEDSIPNTTTGNTEPPSQIAEPSCLQAYEPVASGVLSSAIIGTLLER